MDSILRELSGVLGWVAVTLFSDLISLIYGWLGLRSLWQLAHRWRALLDQNYTTEDSRLAWDLGFFILTPFGVLAHEAAHFAVAQFLGAQDAVINFRLYWGFVTYSTPLSPTGSFAVGAAGPAMSLLLGLVALLLSLRLQTYWRDCLQSFSLATLGLVLIYYPFLSYMTGIGDFRVIYGTSLTLSIIAGLVHGVGLFIFASVAGRLGRRGRSARWSSMADTYPSRMLEVPEESSARLRTLEASWTRFLPGVRQELDELRDLRDWVEEHNRQVRAQLTTGESVPTSPSTST
jgi:hypothetical protein